MKAIDYIRQFVIRKKRENVIRRIFASKDVITAILCCNSEDITRYAIQRYYKNGCYGFVRFLSNSENSNENKQKLVDLLLLHCGSSCDKSSTTHLYEIIRFLEFEDWGLTYILDCRVDPTNSDVTFLELLQCILCNHANHSCVEVLNKLIPRIKDRESLQTIADSTENIFGRAAILEGLGFEEEAAILYFDHEYNACKYSRYRDKSRLEAASNIELVSKIHNQSKLISIALNNGNKFVRRAALQKVQDLEIIDRVAKEDRDQDVVRTAMELSRNPETIAWIALHVDVTSGYDTLNTVRQAIDMIDDHTSLRVIFEHWQDKWTEETTNNPQRSYNRRDIWSNIESTFQHVCGRLGHDYGKRCVCRICSAEEHTFQYPDYNNYEWTEQKETCTRCGAFQIFGIKEVEYICSLCEGTGSYDAYSSCSGEGGSWVESCSCEGRPLKKNEKYRYIIYADGEEHP